MAQLTAAQRRFVDAEKSREIVLKEYSEALQAVADEAGFDSLGKDKEGSAVSSKVYFQDEDGTVYKLVAPAGKWVRYEPVSYVRTRRGDEKSGSLSQKEATEAGFKV